MHADEMVIAALTQLGKPYRFGAEVRLEDPDPPAFDCSELVQWASARAGAPLPDGSGAQVDAVVRAGAVIPLEEAVRTRGALLLRRPRPIPGGWAPGHVAISLGDGRTVEAMDSTHGVCLGRAARPGWDLAALVPGLDYTPRHDAPATDATGGAS